MSKTTIKAEIDANIKQNGEQAITGQILNSVLNDMVDDYAEQGATDEMFSALWDMLLSKVDKAIKLTDGKYISVSPIGEVTDITGATDQNWKSYVGRCVEGAEFNVSTYAPSIAEIPVIAFLDEDLKTIYKWSPASTEYRNEDFIAPAMASYVVINVNISDDEYPNPYALEKSVVPRIAENAALIKEAGINIAEIMGDLKTLSSLVPLEEHKYIFANGSVGEIASIESGSDNGWASLELGVKYGESYNFRGYTPVSSISLVTFLDDDNRILFKSTEVNTFPDGVSYGVPMGATKMIVTCNLYNEDYRDYKLYKYSAIAILVEGFKSIVDDVKVSLKERNYIVADNINDIIDYAGSSDWNWKSFTEKCSPGAEYLVVTYNPVGDGSIPTIGFLDNEDRLIWRSYVKDSTNGTSFVAPEGTARVIVNTNTSSESYPTPVVYRKSKLSSVNETAALANANKESIERVSGNQVIYVDVKKDGTGHFASIQQAIDSITDASPSKRYEIRIYDDWYFANSDLFNFHSGPCAILTKDYINLVGMNGVRRICYLPTNMNDTTCQVMWWQGNCNLKNLHIKIRNSRYAVHCTGNDNHPFGVVREAENCIFEHGGCDDYGVYNQVIAMGLDISDGEHTTFRGCTFIANKTGIWGHANAGDSKDVVFTYENCKFLCRESSITHAVLNENNKFSLFVNNCILSAPVKTELENFVYSGGYADVNINDINPISAHIYGCNEFLFSCEVVNKLTIKSPENVSIVSVGGTAKDFIFGNIFSERKGKNGLRGIVSGSIYCPHDKNTYVTSLGNRLGDCSENNKTLTIVLSNGISKTYTFDENYGTYKSMESPNFTNAEILSSLNASFADIGCEFSDVLGDNYDYYCDSDKKLLMYNDTDEVLSKGTFVKRTPSGGFAKADGNDFIGFLLADAGAKNSVVYENDACPVCVCKAILLDSPYFNATFADGTKVKVEDGVLVATDEGGIGEVSNGMLIL